MRCNFKASARLFTFAAALFTLFITLHAKGGLCQQPVKKDCTEATRLVKAAVNRSDDSQREEDLYKKALRLCPELAEAHYNLGTIYIKRQQYALARDAYKKAMKGRNDVAFKRALAHLELEANELSQSQELYEEILKSKPNDVESVIGIAIILKRKGNEQEAIALLEQHSGANSALLAYNLAVLLEKANRSEQARKQYERAATLDPSHFEALFHLAVLLEKEGKLVEAERYLKQALKVRSDDALLYKLLGVIQEKRGDRARAELSLRKAIALDPEDISPRINLAIILLGNDQEAFASEVLQEALRKDPHSEKALEFLGVAQYRLGKYEDARSTFRKLLVLYPKNQTALAHKEALENREQSPFEAIGNIISSPDTE